MPDLFPELVLVRGGGDLATGVVARLSRAGFPVVVTELANPLTVRRAVALSSAVQDGEVKVEGVIGRRVSDAVGAVELARSGVVPVLVSPDLPDLGVPSDVIIDARLAKRNIDTTLRQAPLVVGLGPGFHAGVDCHAVVETMRGHHLGRVLWSGSAQPNTGTPGIVGGRGAERVLRSPLAGSVEWEATIGDTVTEGQTLGLVETGAVFAPFDGVVRGLIRSGTVVPAGLKIGDVDPRADRSACFEISDKALAVGGGVLEAVLMARRNADS